MVYWNRKEKHPTKAAFRQDAAAAEKYPKSRADTGKNVFA